jgi:hypothetical protein
MQYLKIAEIANKCEVKRQQIIEHYRMVGANREFTDDVRNIFYNTIKDMEQDLKVLENKLIKCIKTPDDVKPVLSDSKNELLRKILYKSNTEYCQSAEDMQSELEEINEMIKELYPDLEEKS